MTHPRNKKPGQHVKYRARRNLQKRGSGGQRGGKPLHKKKLKSKLKEKSEKTLG